MAGSHMTTRLVSALVLLALVAAVCVSLGNWQLDRAAERDAIAQSIESGRQSAPLELRSDTPPQQFQNWRPAQAEGQWLHSFTVLLDNRNFNGRPGFWVATPLRLDDASGMAVLVLRGWIPRPVDAPQELPNLAPPAGIQTISGHLMERVPRLFELWSFGGADPNALPAEFSSDAKGPPRVQNLDLADYADATGLKLLPVVLEQASSATAEPDNTLVREWPLPPTDSDTNRGYALQWFSFAAIAIGAWIAIAWRALRKRRRKPDARVD